MTIGICGAGIMGRGIALNAVLCGHDVVLVDVSDTVRQAASEWVSQQLDKAIEKKKLSAEDKPGLMSKLVVADNVSAFAATDLAIEAVVEKADVKVQVLSSIEAVLPATSILTTNTSSISIASLSKHLIRPAQFAGLHFFNPAHIMKLVEVIRGPRSSDDTIQRCVDLAVSLNKTPAVAKDVPGFIVNRVARNYYNEAQRIVMEQASNPAQVDVLMKGIGFRMGPFELMDLIGVSTNLDVTTSQWQQFYMEPRFTPSLLQKQMVDAGLKFTDGE